MVRDNSITRHLVPWFIITKKESQGEKVRLIADCREINTFFPTKHFKLDHLQNIFPVLRPGMWGAKVDLKHAYFHISLAKELRPYIRMQVGENLWEFQGACFGLNVLPQLFMMVMKTFQKKWAAKGLLTYIYLDDILLLRTTKNQVQHLLDIMLQDLKDSGMQINFSKSIVHPSQNLPHLGFILDLQRGRLLVPPEKLKMVRKELGKIVTKDTMTVRKMSAILGQIRSFLTALPFLRAFTDHLVLFIKNSTNWGWDHQVQIPLDLKTQLKNLTIMFQKWEGRPFLTTRLHRKMAADSSAWAWGGIDLTSGHCLQEFWRSQAGLHINVKEVLAAIHTVKSFAKKNEKVFLLVDNTTTFWYLKKQGGKIDKFNNLLRPFILWCLDKNIDLQVQLVKSADMPADHLSRMPKDKGDYTLNHPLFLHMWSLFKPHLIPFQEMTDMFASPGNAKFKKFYCRHPHWQSVGTDSLNSPLHHLKFCYSNPPWSIIRNWLHRLLQFPELICWTVVPYWVSSSWFPLLKKLIVPKSPIWVVKPFQGMFQNCYAELMPKPRWPLLFCLLSGKCFRGNKFRLKPKTLIWQN